jgi:2-polyprenyl-3-methyl-5-hydroxy-6-metoxy-1,4-benzoquinol methylase
MVAGEPIRLTMSPEVIETFLALCVVSAAAGAASAVLPARRRGPVEGQLGKDVVWVPTPHPLVDKMLDVARVTAEDSLIDLGSGDGRMVIAAAKRGARALGVEYDRELVEVSRRNAQAEGVADRATFVQGDFFEADVADATVLALFLLPEVLETLAPKFAMLKPGTRIVTNRFGIPGWEPQQVSRLGGDSPAFCTAQLFVVGEALD